MTQFWPRCWERNSMSIGKLVWVSITPATQSSQPSKKETSSSGSAEGEREMTNAVGVMRSDVPASRVISFRSRSL